MSLSEFARIWTKALVGTCYVPMTRDEKTRFLHGLADRLAGALRTEQFDPGIAQQVGVDLASAGFTAPEALGRTVSLIHARLLAELGFPGDEQRQRIPDLIEAFTTGFAHTAHIRTLDEQDEMRKASVAAGVKAESALRQSEARFRHAALHDPLTGLPNRIFFIDQLAEALTLAWPSDRVGVCFLDIDKLQTVNNSLGHPVGDQLLQAIGDRLNNLGVEAGHFVAHLGGDKFAILMRDTTCADDAVKVADKALAVINEPVEVDQHRLSISGYAGIVERAAEHTDTTDVMRAADITLHWAKGDGKSRLALFEAERSAEDIARYELSAAMPAALANGEFFLEYQPLVDLASDKWIGVEALARWRHPTKGVLRPDSFICLAEDTGLIVHLGMDLLELACRQAVQWCGDDPDGPIVSVNFAGHQIDQPGLVAGVAAVLDRTGLPPNRLQLEITESAVVRSDCDTVNTLRQLVNLGPRIAIDDFGTGWSNLSYLLDLPIHGVKLAGKFLRGRHDLLASIVTMVQSLGFTVTAEGIETVEDVQRLQRIGCDAGQGYYFGRPVPADALPHLSSGTPRTRIP